MTEQPSFISKEKFDALIISIGKTARALLDNFTPALDKAAKALREFNDRWAWLCGEGPAERYKLAGRPYGNHTRGKKRWTLEQKRRMKAQ